MSRSWHSGLFQKLETGRSSSAWSQNYDMSKSLSLFVSRSYHLLPSLYRLKDERHWPQFISLLLQSRIASFTISQRPSICPYSSTCGIWVCKVEEHSPRYTGLSIHTVLGEIHRHRSISFLTCLSIEAPHSQEWTTWTNQLSSQGHFLWIGWKNSGQRLSWSWKGSPFLD